MSIRNLRNSMKFSKDKETCGDREWKNGRGYSLPELGIVLCRLHCVLQETYQKMLLNTNAR